MKKLLISFATLTTSVSLYALPVGNPWEASLHTDGVFCAGECNSSKWCDAWSFRVGFYGDYVFDRHMQINTKESNAHVHNTQIVTEAAYLAFNVWNRADLFLTLGKTKVRFEAPERTFGNPINPNDYTVLETNSGFSWSIGARATLWECGCFGVGAEAQYFYTRPHINFAHNLGVEDVRYQPNNVNLKYREWQAGIGAAYRINIICEGTALIPYIALRVGKAQMSADNLTIISAAGFDTFFNLESDENWGYAVGTTLLGCNKISVTAEARLLSEKALYINAQLRF